jgi:hypothetical protein
MKDAVIIFSVVGICGGLATFNILTSGSVPWSCLLVTLTIVGGLTTLLVAIKR